MYVCTDKYVSVCIYNQIYTHTHFFFYNLSCMKTVMVFEKLYCKIISTTATTATTTITTNKIIFQRLSNELIRKK